MLSLIEAFLTFLTAIVNVCFPSCCCRPSNNESPPKRKRRYSITKTTTETTTIETIGSPITELE